jgi:uncharacterized membrane protein
MKNLSTTVAAYDNETLAEKDWAALESAARAGSVYLADAALVMRDASGTVRTVHRQSHHGWGKGAVAGAVVGLLFPPAILAGAVAGAAGGGIVARLSRGLRRGDIKDLGDVMDSENISMVVLTDEGSVRTLGEVLEGATRTVSRASCSAEELQEVISSEAASPF